MPNTKNPHQGGSRKNKGKPKMSLISPVAMTGLARVLTWAAVPSQMNPEPKYAVHNWAQGLDIAETIDSLERHIAELKRGVFFDPETNECIVDQMQANTMFLSHFFHTGQWHDLDGDMMYHLFDGEVPDVYHDDPIGGGPLDE